MRCITIYRTANGEPTEFPTFTVETKEQAQPKFLELFAAKYPGEALTQYEIVAVGDGMDLEGEYDPDEDDSEVIVSWEK